MRRRALVACFAVACVLIPLTVAHAAAPAPSFVTRRVHLTATAVQPVVALTFDDGPSAYTADIVRTLKRKGATATFFQVGRNVRKRPAVSRLVVKNGMAIGNHSMTHDYMDDWLDRWLSGDLAEAQDAVFAAAGVRPRWYKPPYMIWNPAYDTVLPSLGLGLCWPDCAPDDWDGWTARRIADAVVADVQPGTVIGLHDGSPDDAADRSATVRATALIVDRLKAKGYRFVTLDQLTNAQPGR
jgi:peptidoglycan/xylan/chitin deacetylase (PgdA/CDA1 family)